MGASPNDDQPDKMTKGDIIFAVAFVLILAFAYWASKYSS